MTCKNYIQIQPIELKPCPFCGNEKIVTMYNRTSGDAVVKCENCRAEVRVDSTGIHTCLPSFDNIIERITAACDKRNDRV